MRLLVSTLAVVLAAAGLSSCFLVSIPVKATGELIEKGAYATGDAMNRGIHRVTTPDTSAGTHRAGTYEAGTYEESWDNGADDGTEWEDLPPLLPQR
jgi:hypothetical protein